MIYLLNCHNWATQSKILEFQMNEFQSPDYHDGGSEKLIENRGKWSALFEVFECFRISNFIFFMSKGEII